MAAKLTALKKLAQRPSDASHHDELDAQATALKNDRGYCLLITSMLENNLDEALEHGLPNLAESRRDEFFDQEGPGGSFSRKIELAAALGIVGPITHRNLTYIRHLRNAFAHAKSPIDFNTKEVAEACNELKLLDPFFPKRHRVEDFANGPRGRFEDVISTTMMMLAVYAGYKQPPASQISSSQSEKMPLP